MFAKICGMLLFECNKQDYWISTVQDVKILPRPFFMPPSPLLPPILKIDLKRLSSQFYKFAVKKTLLPHQNVLLL